MAEKNNRTAISDEDKKAFIDLVASFPLIGSSAAFLLKLSKRGLNSVFIVFILLLAYPLVAFSIVLILLHLSPSFLQDGTRRFVLASLGVDQKVQNEIFRNNSFIDFSRTMVFVASEKESQPRNFQDLRVGQRVRMRQNSQIIRLPGSEGCGATQSPEITRYGTILVNIDGLEYQTDRSITAQGHELDEIGSTFWKAARKRFPLYFSDRQEVTLSWSFQPSPELREANPGKCYDAITALAITVYKPNT